MAFNENARYHEVESVKRGILESKKNPQDMLIELFEFCKDEFDVTGVKEKLPQMFESLKEFCASPPRNHDELKVKAKPVVVCFNEHKELIRSVDVQFFYALLNFVDMLKAKHIYQFMI